MKKDRLESVRQQLLEKQRQLRAELGRDTLYRDQLDDSIKDLGDQASSAYSREFALGLGNGKGGLLRDVAAALQRIEDGSYGTCERCGEPIAEKRLAALPFARHCIACQRLVEDEERMAG